MWIPVVFSSFNIPIMSVEEELLQKALGTYPTEFCTRCYQRVYIDEMYMCTKSLHNENIHYPICIKCRTENNVL